MNQRLFTGLEPGNKPSPSSERGYVSYSSLRRRGTTSRTPLRGSPSERGKASSPYSGSCGKIGGKSSGGGSGSTCGADAPGSGLNSDGGKGASLSTVASFVATRPTLARARPTAMPGTALDPSFDGISTVWASMQVTAPQTTTSVQK